MQRKTSCSSPVRDEVAALPTASKPAAASISHWLRPAKRPAATHHHHERGVGLVEVGEIMKRRQLIERPEVGDRSAAAETDDHAVPDTCRERIAPRGVLSEGNLRAKGRDGGKYEYGCAAMSFHA